MAASSHKTIYAALAANLLIAVTKFIAGAISNSAAMIAEGVHSLVDTVNELLLLLGLHRSKKKPDASHPFGYGKELYFWSFIVSIMIFGLGGGISIYQGIAHIIKPEEMGDPTVNYIVLGLSIIFEGTSLIIAIKQFNQVRGTTPFWEAVVKSKDPSSFLVLFEDAAAVAGLFIVMIFVYLSHAFNKPYLDGVASLLVGLILVVVSAILARESRSLLMGEGVSSTTRDKICHLVEGNEQVIKVQHILSTYQSPTEVLMMLIVAFKEDMDTGELNVAIDRIRDQVKAEFEFVRFIMIQPESVEHHMLWNDDSH
ncbi:cation diffusion facilitator family transporter [Mucilaginibacter pedocola]|uniref:Cation transporter n=1 Tax=Mucilaginibacter pedocola TaxID=1792845 RepID=A0A1S9PLG4_9SPHI|nr:cation diffusion facilitator family transporter [Mucilaginibacter pedocola]OOQ61781.1 cation transporter [Mucilaginibacter pedocola]